MIKSQDIPQNNDNDDHDTDNGGDGDTERNHGGGGVGHLIKDHDSGGGGGGGDGGHLIGGEPVHQLALAVVAHTLHEKHHSLFLVFDKDVCILPLSLHSGWLGFQLHPFYRLSL